MEWSKHMATITPAQLKAVLAGCNNLSVILDQIRELATVADATQISGAALDQITINNMLAQYSILKQNLLTTANTLP
jgi:hypothetical protein